MTLTPLEIAAYAGALFILFMTPGPVWVALLARSVSGGFNAAWPLAIGVAVGDVIWPLLAILGVSYLVSTYAEIQTVLRIAAAVIFFVMGYLLIRYREKDLSGESRLTRPGMWAGFVAGLAVILGNPKAIVFYMTILPGFFDVSNVTAWDMAVICFLSALVPLVGNLLLGLAVNPVRRFLKTPGAVARTNLVAGVLLILVGLLILAT